jgi:hypothetical protein
MKAVEGNVLVLKITINLSLSTAYLCTILHYGTSSGLSAAALNMILCYGVQVLVWVQQHLMTCCIMVHVLLWVQKHFMSFNVHGSVHHINILLYIIPTSTQFTGFISIWHCSTCFGRHYHPSSGAQNNCNYSIW